MRLPCIYPFSSFRKCTFRAQAHSSQEHPARNRSGQTALALPEHLNDPQNANAVRVRAKLPLPV